MFLDLLEEDKKNAKSCLSSLSREVEKKLAEVDFPSRKSEAFRYLSLRSIEKGVFSLNNEEYSFDIDHTDVEVMLVDEAIEKYGIAILNRFAKMMEKEDSYFSLVNQKLASNAICIFVNRSVDGVVDITEHFNDNNTFAAPRVYVFATQNANVVFHHRVKVQGQENFIARHLDVSIERGAKVEVYESYEIEGENSYFSHVRATVKEGGKFVHRTAIKGSKLFRSEVKAYLLEKNADVTLEGFWNGSNSDSIHHHVNCTHLAPNCNSRQHYQGVVEDQSRASFEGQIYVDKVAQKTDSYQLSKHLLVGEKSRGYSKPNLEVFADDVKASHGACVSMLEDEELFYFASRGIDKEEARKHLQKSFLSFYLDQIEQEKIRKDFTRLIYD